jgi:hypothetical protein
MAREKSIPVLHRHNFFVLLGFELRVLPLVYRCSTTWVSCVLGFWVFLTCFSYFSDSVSWSFLGPVLDCYPLLRYHIPEFWAPCLAYLLRWGFTNILLGLSTSHESSDLHSLSSWDYRYEPSHLAWYLTSLQILLIQMRSDIDLIDLEGRLHYSSQDGVIYAEGYAQRLSEQNGEFKISSHK